MVLIVILLRSVYVCRRSFIPNARSLLLTNAIFLQNAAIYSGIIFQDARTASNDKASNEQIKNEILLIPPNISILIGFKQFKMH